MVPLAKRVAGPHGATCSGSRRIASAQVGGPRLEVRDFVQRAIDLHFRPLVNDLTYRTMTLDLSDEETAALARLLTTTIDDDRYPFSRRIRTLKAILAKIRPEPVRQPLPPLKRYEPPRATAARRRR